MVTKLSPTVTQNQSLSISSNSTIINVFSIYRNGNGSSKRHQNNSLNVLIEFANPRFP
jgi:hypothetical protein